VQEAALRAFRYFQTFAGGNGRAWFLRIVRNTCIRRPLPALRARTDPFDEERHSHAREDSNPETLLLQTDDVKLVNTAMGNLRAWSEQAPWTDEVADGRHVLSSDTGGGDAARILLDEVRRHIVGECGGPARVLVALPDRDLLVAASLQPGDETFAEQFAAFAVDLADGAHEPLERARCGCKPTMR